MVGTAARSLPGREFEREFHATVAQLLRLVLRPPTTWTTFPAGGGGLERARMLQRQGLRPGWPDILVLHPEPTAIEGCRSVILVGLELKTEIGRQSLAQRTVEAEFTVAGGRYALCRSLDDVQAALSAAGIPMVGTRATA